MCLGLSESLLTGSRCYRVGKGKDGARGNKVKENKVGEGKEKGKGTRDKRVTEIWGRDE